MAKRPQSSIIWPEGRPRPLPTDDRDQMRRLLQNPETTFGGPWLEWLKGRLELEPPQFVSADLGGGVQKIIEENEVTVGQEAKLDFQDYDLVTASGYSGINFTVTNVPGVRDIVGGEVVTRLVNPDDILVDGALAPYIDLTAGSVDFNETATQLPPYYNAYTYCGRSANYDAGFALQMYGRYTSVTNLENVNLQSGNDDNAAGSSISSYASASIDLPAAGAYTGAFDTGWQTLWSPPSAGPGAASDYLFCRFGGDPYNDVFASNFTGTGYWRWVWVGVSGDIPGTGGNTLPNGSATVDQIAYWDATIATGSAGGEWVVADSIAQGLVTNLTTDLSTLTATGVTNAANALKAKRLAFYMG